MSQMPAAQSVIWYFRAAEWQESAERQDSGVRVFPPPWYHVTTTQYNTLHCCHCSSISKDTAGCTSSVSFHCKTMQYPATYCNCSNGSKDTAGVAGHQSLLFPSAWRGAWVTMTPDLRWYDELSQKNICEGVFRVKISLWKSSGGNQRSWQRIIECVHHLFLSQWLPPPKPREALRR